MTNKDMLTRWVERAVRGGWNKYCKWKIALDPHRRLCVFITESKSSFHHNGLSLPDLISDSEFMKAVYGEEWLCFKCGERVTSTDEAFNPLLYCSTCNVYTYVLPASHYHAHKAFDLLLNKGNPIQYLYDNMPKEGV